MAQKQYGGLFTVSDFVTDEQFASSVSAISEHLMSRSSEAGPGVKR